jgi:hypothetical protein
MSWEIWSWALGEARDQKRWLSVVKWLTLAPLCSSLTTLKMDVAGFCETLLRVSVYTATDVNTVELHLSRLIGTFSHPNVQTIRIIGFFFENRLLWQFEVEKISTNSDFRIHTYLLTNKTQILFLICIWRLAKTVALKRCSTVTTTSVFLKGQSDPNNWRFG